MNNAKDDEAEADRRRAGLCAGCVNARRIESNRGSVFYLCELSGSNPAYPKYPRLPVIRCNGYVELKVNSV